MKKHILLVLLFFVGLIVSAIQPKEYFIWFLEVFPAILGFIIICFTYKKFHFANFTYFLILIHCYILFIGGHYTYAEVPLFNWIREIFDQSRNNYDKLGHFAQGFIPAAIIREIFIRKNVLNKLNWLPFITISICLAISAFYELIEWLISILTKEEGDSFLGTQGYIWDTQSDMLFALIGAITMVVFLSKFQDKQIKNINLETLSS
jgi:putative membrane protein